MSRELRNLEERIADCETRIATLEADGVKAADTVLQMAKILTSHAEHIKIQRDLGPLGMLDIMFGEALSEDEPA